MAEPSLQVLLAAVTRRLWLVQFTAAIRLALWVSAGLLLLAAATRLLGLPVTVLAWALLLALTWVAALLRAALQRPPEAASALWADRHLGGASAFSTLLEARSGRQRAPNPKALCGLESWVQTRIASSLDLLDRHRDSHRLARPLLAALTSAGFAALVLALPGLAPPPTPAASVTAAKADAATADARPGPTSDRVSAIEKALRSSAPEPDVPEQQTGRGAGVATAPGEARPSGASTPPQSAQAAATGLPASAGQQATPAALAEASAATAGAVQVAGAGAGRQAGDSRDERADVGVSKALRGTMAMPRSQPPAGRRSDPSQVDGDRAAAFDDELLRAAAATTRLAQPAAATPPPASQSQPLSPAQNSYVQAWMKASARRP